MNRSQKGERNGGSVHGEREREVESAGTYYSSTYKRERERPSLHQRRSVILTRHRITSRNHIRRVRQGYPYAIFPCFLVSLFRFLLFLFTWSAVMPRPSPSPSIPNSVKLLLLGLSVPPTVRARCLSLFSLSLPPRITNVTVLAIPKTRGFKMLIV